MPTPCLACPKPPVWAIKAGMNWKQLRKLAEPLEMTEENRDAFDAYKRFKAINRFPEDEIVEWYSGIIRELEDVRASNQLDMIVLNTRKIGEYFVQRWGTQ